MRLLREAEEITTGVRVLYRLVCRAFDPEIAASGLTVPQVGVMEELAREDGLSLKELSSRVALSHSTVSGIVDRLEQRGLVGRRTDPDDRRYNRVFLSEEVRGYVRDVVPNRTLGPVLKALERAGVEDRTRVLAGIRTLRRLLESPDAGDEGGGGTAAGVRATEGHR